MKQVVSLALAATLSLGAVIAVADDKTPSAEGAKVYFVNLSDGDTVTSPVFIQFGLSSMGIAPAGVEKEHTGHHHLLINAELKGEDLDYAVPADEQHIHFGKGQTEATLELPKGTHTLQLVLGDWSHVPHDKPVMSERITVTVE
jgi:hypothetical protein